MIFENNLINAHDITVDFKYIKSELINRLNSVDHIEIDLLDKLKTMIYNSDGHNFESRYGNNKGTLSNSELLKAYKLDAEKSIRYIEYRYKFKYYPNNKELGDFPILLAIEPSKSCNLKCIMCFQSNEDFNSKGDLMSTTTFNKIIEEIKSNDLPAVVFASRGEPLLHPHIDDMINKVYDAGVIDIKLNTNGLLLTEHMSRKLLRSQLDTLVFSVDSIDAETYKSIRGADLSKVLKNIETFNSIKVKEFPNSKLKTRVSMVMLSDFNNCKDIEDIKLFWRGKVDEFAIKTENNFKGKYKNNNCSLGKSCSLLWERLYIWYDGDINPCDIDYNSKLCLGNINYDKKIGDAWNSKEMNFLRNNHLSKLENIKPCITCECY